MADFSSSLKNIAVAQNLTASPFVRETATLSPAIRDAILRLPPGVSPMPRPAPEPAPAPAPQPAPPVVPVAPASNPFDSLPFPSPGDRIKADDFKALSQALKTIADMAALSGSLFGRTFVEAKLALAGQGYQIFRVMSVFGAEIADLGDASLDARKVIQVTPVALGDRRMTLVVTEAVDTRKFAPNLMGLTYQEAQERIQALVGDLPQSAAPTAAPQLVGLSLADLVQNMNR